MKILCSVISFIMLIVSIIIIRYWLNKEESISQIECCREINEKSSNDEIIKLIKSYSTENDIYIKDKEIIIKYIKGNNTPK